MARCGWWQFTACVSHINVHDMRRQSSDRQTNASYSRCERGWHTKLFTIYVGPMLNVARQRHKLIFFFRSLVSCRASTIYVTSFFTSFINFFCRARERSCWHNSNLKFAQNKYAFHFFFLFLSILRACVYSVTCIDSHATDRETPSAI